MPSAVCDNCHQENPAAARYCARCGAVLARSAAPRDPIPAGFEPLPSAPQLALRMESALGGEALLAVEGLRIEIVNCGPTLADLRFRIRGEDAAQQSALDAIREVEHLANNARITLEIPSYDVAAPLARVEVELVEATTARAG